jgi:DNA-binding SARP family transcriptional activator
MNSKVTYHQQVSYCGKPRCKKCREGTGHGPYWYSYRTVNGRTTRTYVGKHLPPDVEAQMVGGSLEPPSVSEAERDQSTIRIYTLGQFRLERRNPRDPRDWQTVTDPSWQHQRVRSLLACLASVENHKLGREQIMDALWPDLDIETAGNRLDRSVYSLRQVLEPSRTRPATSPYLLTEREMLVLVTNPQIWIDADVFEQLIARAHATNDLGEQEHLLDQAAKLYGGPFLPEVEESKNEWTRVRRESLQRSRISLLLDLADLRIRRDALPSAIESLERLLTVDPANEAAVQRLMLVLKSQGRRVEAIRAYKKLVAVLQQEYRIAPLPETRAIYDELRVGGGERRQGQEGGASPPLRQGIETGVVLDTGTRAGTGGGSSASLNGAQAPAIQIGRAHQVPLVGREREIEMLKTLVSTTANAAKFRPPTQRRSSLSSFDPQRRPQCVLLQGEVGIGKTRLAEEVSREAKRQGWAVAWSRVYAQEGTIPYRLWTEVLRKAMEQGVWRRQDVSRRPFVFQPLMTLLPELNDLLPQVTLDAALPPEQEQLRLWEAACALLTLISEGTPLLIALDDLQWSDGSSCELLAYLARRIHGLPILIVGTCRDNELIPNHPLRSLITDLLRENSIETVSLDRLSDKHIEDLVSHIPHVPELLVSSIRERAGGNPFFAEELARTVDAVDGATGNLLMNPVLLNPTNSHELLPDTITAVLELRMSRLSPDCQRLLSKAAVLGGAFKFEIISDMEASAPNFNEDKVLELLEEGMRSGMLTEEGIGTRITYHFWHPLLVDHLYKSLSAARRSLLHRRAADIFLRDSKGREEEEAANITHHLVKGGASSDLIVKYAELAGDRAHNLPSYPEAEQHYRTALEYFDQHGGDWQRLAYLLEMLGECTWLQGKYEESYRFYEQALEVHNRQPVPTSSDDYQQECQVRALLWCEMGVTWYYRGNIQQAQECYQQSGQVLSDAGLVDGPAWAYLQYLQGVVKYRSGKYDDARLSVQGALSLFESFNNVSENVIDVHHATLINRILAGDPINLGRTHSLLGLIAANQSQCNEALMHLNIALTLYEQRSLQREISMACGNLGHVHMKKAEYGLAQSFFQRTLSIAERIGGNLQACGAFGNLGMLALRLGNLSDAEHWYLQGVRLAKRINDPVFMSGFHSYLASVLHAQGKIAEAKENLGVALRMAKSARIPPCMGWFLVVWGNIRVFNVLYDNAATTKSEFGRSQIQRLKRAKWTILRALKLKNIEAETNMEGQLVLAYIELLLGNVDTALELGLKTMKDADRAELAWLVAQTMRVLGEIFAAKGFDEEADKYLGEALSSYRKSKMRLEEARTLYSCGKTLLARASGRKNGLEYLREAQKIFAECGAVLDLQMVEHTLSVYQEVSKR